MTVDDVEREIASTRATIAKSQSANAELTHQRAKALESGNDGAVDRIEVDMRINDTAITRGRERIVILERRLEETRQAEREAALDALTSEADAARIEGELLIREYAEHAAAIAPILLKLKTIDQRVADANRQLQKAGRDQVNASNAIRCRPMSFGTRTVRRKVGVGEPEHPLHKVHTFDRNGNCRLKDTNEPIEQFGEFDIVEKTHDRGVYADPLYDSVQLPGVDPNGAPIWPNPLAAKDVLAAAPTIAEKVRGLLTPKAA